MNALRTNHLHIALNACWCACRGVHGNVCNSRTFIFARIVARPSRDRSRAFTIASTSVTPSLRNICAIGLGLPCFLITFTFNTSAPALDAWSFSSLHEVETSRFHTNTLSTLLDFPAVSCFLTGGFVPLRSAVGGSFSEGPTGSFVPVSFSIFFFSSRNTRIWPSFSGDRSSQYIPRKKKRVQLFLLTRTRPGILSASGYSSVHMWAQKELDLVINQR